MKLTTRSNTLLTMLAAIFAMCLSFSVFAKSSGSESAMTVIFEGDEYHHRWSRKGRNEFTPSGQADLAQWRNMLSVNVHKKVVTPEQLAAMANHALGLYQDNGYVLRTDSKSDVANSPAEYFFSSVFVQPTFVEVAFSRFMLREGIGMIVVFSQRFYGEDAQEELLDWVKTSGVQAEDALMAWEAIPAVSDLERLPQS